MMDDLVKNALKKEGLFTLLLLGSILAGAFLFLFPEDKFSKTKEFFTSEHTAPIPSVLSSVSSGSTLSSAQSQTQTASTATITLKSGLGEPFDTFQQLLGAHYSFVIVPEKNPTVFETITPYSNLVDIKKISVLKDGVGVATFYQMKRKDSSIGELMDFLRRLVKNIRPDAQVTIQDTVAYGKDGFLYNNLAKKDNFRIVVLSRDGLVYAWDILLTHKSDFDEVLKRL